MTIQHWTHWTAAEADPKTLLGALHHWVIKPVTPVADLLTLPTSALTELWSVLDDLVGDQPGWCMVLRVGDPQRTGGPVGQVDVTVSEPGTTPGVRLQVSGRPAC